MNPPVSQSGRGMTVFGSVCSGIEAASVAWKPLGWRCAFMSEIEAFPRAVLAHHHPETPLHGDFTTIREGQYDPIDVLVGGTPCQSFSVAGLRGGMADDRGNLALQFLALAGRLRPLWVVWENVPGVLSSNGGRDFGSFVGGLGELGYGWAYRTLDAQYFGLAQRRKRVFVVGHLGDWRRAAAVLFERSSLSGNPAPRREAGPSVAALTAHGVGTCGADDNQGQAGHLISAYGGNDTRGPIDISTALSSHGGPHGRLDFESETFVASTAPPITGNQYGDHESREGLLVATAFKASHFTRGKDGAPSDLAPPLSADADKGDQDILVHASAFDARQRDVIQYGDHAGPLDTDGYSQAVAFSLRGREGGAMPEPHEKVSALRAASGGSTRDYVAFAQNQRDEVRQMDIAGALASEPGMKQQTYVQASAVRRLTPRECARLQGFPDDYLDIQYRGKPAADGPKYKALGNSMAVPCMRWLGERIALVDGLPHGA